MKDSLYVRVCLAYIGERNIFDDFFIFFMSAVVFLGEMCCVLSIAKTANFTAKEINAHIYSHFR
jgi:hypothetical protein